MFVAAWQFAVMNSVVSYVRISEESFMNTKEALQKEACNNIFPFCIDNAK